jgi:hypothetical protein
VNSPAATPHQPTLLLPVDPSEPVDASSVVIN